MSTQPDTLTGDDDMRWVHGHMEELRPYQGKWIAVRNRRVIAAGDTVTELIDAAEAQGIEEIFVTQVPEDIDRETIFIG